MTVTAIYFHHRAALEYDFRARFGFGVERIDRQELSWQETAALVDGVFTDHTSHTFAAIQGWAYVPSPQEVAFFDELDVKRAMNRGKNQPVPKRADRPWERKREVEALPAPGNSGRRSRLNERLGLGGVVNADNQPDG